MKTILPALLTTLLLSSCFQTDITSPNNKEKEDENPVTEVTELSLFDTTIELSLEKNIEFTLSAQTPLEYDGALLWSHKVLEKNPKYPNDPAEWNYKQFWDTSYTEEYTFAFDTLEQNSFTICVKEEGYQSKEVNASVTLELPSLLPSLSLNDFWKYRMEEIREENGEVESVTYYKTFTISSMQGSFPDSFTVVEIYNDGTEKISTIHSSQTTIPLGGGENNDNTQPVNLCNEKSENTDPGWLKKRQLIFDEARTSCFLQVANGKGGYGYGSNVTTKGYPGYGVTYFKEYSGNSIGDTPYYVSTSAELVEFNGNQF